jgi:hypothetical protein
MNEIKNNDEYINWYYLKILKFFILLL